MSCTRLSAGVLTVLLVSLTSSRGSAYRTVAELPEFQSSGQDRIAWRPGEIAFGFAGPESTYLSHLAVMQSLIEQLDGIRCMDAPVRVAPPSGLSPALGDRLNTVRYLGDAWQSEFGLPSDVMAITDLEYELNDSGSWEIVEADILVNQRNFEFAYPVATPAAGIYDLKAVLNHELGHALGLIHACEINGAGGTPDCSTDPGFAIQTMFPTYQGSSQSEWSAEDIAGLCFLSPSSVCDSACGEGTECVAGACATVCGSAVCEPFQVCERGECRERCGGVMCASGDVCEDGACRATCSASATLCPVGTFCGPSAECIRSECSAEVANCPRRACWPDAPCSAGLSCKSGVCVTDDAYSARCRRDSNCADSERCVGGICQSGWAELADPCESNSDCATGLCADGYCRIGCDAESSCSGGSCVSETYCASSRLAFGLACSSGSQCSGGACVHPEGSTNGVCTRSCSIAADDCPHGYVCESFDGPSVCRPAHPAAMCSSSVVDVRGPTRWLVAAAFLIVVIRRSRRQT